MSVLMADEFINRFCAFILCVIMWIYIEYVVQAGLVDCQGSDWRPSVYTHDFIGTIRCGMRFGKLPGGRIGCHFQAFHVALSCLLLICLDSHDLSYQGRELLIYLLFQALYHKLLINQYLISLLIQVPSQKRYFL